MSDTTMDFFCVYVKTRKKFEKYSKVNRVRGKVVIDVKKIITEEDLNPDDKTYLKILIFNKIQNAIEKKRTVYYIPDFDNEFSLEKLMNLKKIASNVNFNVLVFYNDFRKDNNLLDEVLSNLDKFSNSQIIRDY